MNIGDEARRAIGDHRTLPRHRWKVVGEGNDADGTMRQIRRRKGRQQSLEILPASQIFLYDP